MNKINHLKSLGKTLHEMSETERLSDASRTLVLKDAAAYVQEYAAAINMLRSIAMDMEAIKAILDSDYFAAPEDKAGEINAILDSYFPYIQDIS